MAWIGPTAVAANRAEERRRQQEQEEEMSEYTHEDLDRDWEFKIVRSETGVFRKAEVVQQLIEEEARAGWVLLEKLDNRRIRFKRPISARGRDMLLPKDVDPYRTTYGRRSAAPAALIGLTLGLLVAGLLALFLTSGNLDLGSFEWSQYAIIGVLVFVILIMVVIKASSRRRR
jgi:hypothetical protein